MEIKILGPGCAKCEKTAKLVQEVVAETGAQARVVKVRHDADRRQRCGIDTGCDGERRYQIHRQSAQEGRDCRVAEVRPFFYRILFIRQPWSLSDRRLSPE